MTDTLSLPGSKQTPKSSLGFTLLEVLVAVAILGSTLAVLLSAVNRNLIIASDSKNLAIAGMLAQKKLSEIELEGFPEPRRERGEFEEAPGFTWQLSVTPINIRQLGIEIRAIHLVVIWDEGKKDFEITMAMSDIR